MESPVIPSDYSQWHHCIVHECGISLDESYLASRISVLENSRNEQTVQFVRLYGEVHHTRVLHWFRQALAAIK